MRKLILNIPDKKKFLSDPLFKRIDRVKID